MWYLMRCSCGNEDGIPLTLRIRIPNHAVLVKQTLSQLPFQVHALVMDGVIVGLQLLSLL